ncbi:MAG TPA: glycosyltransferase family 39 protein [Verrucomicrobiae bacterium]|nr:glycosyltransferase family 39 protein [Verrucomicrobiae bacterium]
MQNLFAKRPALAIFGISLALYLCGAWILPLSDRDEPRFSEATREMLQRGDGIVPWFNGDYRFDKPPLIYWAQMPCYELLGENEFAARLPSALFAAGTAVLVFFWTCRLAKPATAFSAGIIFATALQVIIHAHLAVADMPMVFFTAAATWSGWEWSRPDANHRGRWWWFLFVSLALGFLAKGPVAWLPALGLLLFRIFRPRDFHFSWLSFVGGLLLMLGIVGIWGIPALIVTHGEFLYVGIGKHVIYRSFDAMEGHGAGGWKWLLLLPLYFATFFFSFFPWAFCVPKALWNWWPMRCTDVCGLYLLVQASLVFLVFSLVTTKLIHYTMPAFPAIAVWLAREIERGAMGRVKVAKWAGIMAVLAVVVTIPGFLALKPEFPSAQLFEEAKPLLKPEMKFAALDYTEPSLVWKFRGVLTNYMETVDARQAADFLQQTNPFVLVAPTDFCRTNSALLTTNMIAVQTKGINLANGKIVDLTAIVNR